MFLNSWLARLDEDTTPKLLSTYFSFTPKLLKLSHLVVDGFFSSAFVPTKSWFVADWGVDRQFNIIHTRTILYSLA
jgi:hypothetical protein